MTRSILLAALGALAACAPSSNQTTSQAGNAAAPDVGNAKPLAVRLVDGDIYIHLPEALGAAA